MEYKVIWSPNAIECVHKIGLDIVRLDSVINAEKVISKIEKKVASLSSFPESGRMVPEFPGENLREVFVVKKRIIYEIIGKSVNIVAIHDGRKVLFGLDSE